MSVLVRSTPSGTEYVVGEWTITSMMHPHRRRREYACIRDGRTRAFKDTLDLAIRYCERDGHAFTLPWKDTK